MSTITTPQRPRVSVPVDQIEHAGDTPNVPDEVVDLLARMLLDRAASDSEVFSTN